MAAAEGVEGDGGPSFFWAPWASAALAGLLGGLCLWASYGFCVDDAYIHLSYAKSLRLGDGLSYNPGDWETGASSPLWLLLLLPLALLEHPEVSVQLLGVCLHALTAAGAALCASARTRRHAGLAAATAGGFTAAHPGLLQASVSGMEVSLAAALLSLCLWAALSGRTRLGFALGVLSVWARPEALLLLSVFALLWRLVGRSRIGFAPALGSLAGLGAWVLYDLAVSGYPWPNTRYAKETTDALLGLSYLPAQVAPHEPWLLGLGAVALAVLSLRNPDAGRARLLPLALLGSWLGAALAVAISRQLDPEVLFFHRRYFLPLSVVGTIALGAGVTFAGAGRQRLWLLPVAALSILLALQVQGRQRLQERGIQRVHAAPAHFAARNLPADAVILVEGAGASRFLTPRSMRIVDMLGLNDRVIAHVPWAARPCVWVRREPTHMLVPGQLLRLIRRYFDVSLIVGFKDPTYAQLSEISEHGVLLLRSAGPTEYARSRCVVDGP